MNNKKAQFVNTLTITVVLVLLVVGIFQISSNPDITGYAAKEKKADKAISKEISDNGEARVIVILKDEDKTTKKDEKAYQKKIKDKQDVVLKNIDYATEKDIKEKKQSASNKELKLKNKFSSTPGFTGTVNQQGLDKLKADPNVEKIIIDKKKSISLSTSVSQIHAPDVWGMQPSGRNITGKDQAICIVDTGVDYTHEMLGSCTVTNVTEGKCKVIGGYDFVNLDNDPNDDHSHGTHCAGIAAGNGSLKGVAPDSNIVAIKSLDSGGSGWDSDILAGIDWCITNSTKFNITVISLSLGDSGQYNETNPCPTEYDSLFQTAQSKGILIVAASGNEYYRSGISAPACSPLALSVGAVNSADSAGSFTNVGSLLEVLAPGNNIVSAQNGGGTTTKTGTSMAAPHVAGLAALLYQYQKDANNRTASSIEIEKVIKQSNVKVNAFGFVLPRVDALQSVNSIFVSNSTTNSANNNLLAIQFNSNTQLSNISEAFVFENEFISLNSSKYQELNKSANITFYNLSYVHAPVILRNGVYCNDCAVYDYTSDKNVSFSVPHFTNYSLSANSRLEIFDQYDLEGGSRFAGTNSQIYFYANYTNVSNNEGISTANCAINVSDSNAVMNYNSSSKLFEFNRTFSTSTSYQYNLSCSDVSFEPLNTSDSIFISPSCLDQTPNVNITIAEGTTANCDNESITLINQSIFVYGDLLLNQSYLSLDVAIQDANAIYLYNGTLFVLNSTINATRELFKIYGYNESLCNLTYSNLFNNQFEFYNNSEVIIMHSNFTAPLNFYDNSLGEIRNSFFSHPTYAVSSLGHSNVTIQNSVFNTDVVFDSYARGLISNSILMKNTSFKSNSSVEITNSTVSEIAQLGSSPSFVSKLNFTLPASNITNKISFRYNSSISGYVDMPAQLAIMTPGIMNSLRYYPVQVNYTNGNPVVNREVNVTNSTGDVVYSTLTDSNGVAWININYTSATNGTFYNVTINPTQSVGLLSDTPLMFTLDNPNTPPIVNNVFINSTFGTNYTNENLTAYWNSTDADGNNITLVYNWYKNNILNATSLITNGLIRYYPLNNDTLDYYGASDGTASSGASLTSSGKIGNSYAFNGVNGNISLPTSSLPYSDSNRTICLWAKPAGNTGTWQWAFDYGTVATGNNWFIGRGFTDPTALVFGRFASEHIVLNVWEEGNWTHVCTSYNGTTIFAYANGVEVSQVNEVVNTAEGVANIGFQFTEYWNGTIDEVLIYNRTLSNSEIKVLYDGSKLGGSVLSHDLTKAGDIWKVGITGYDYLSGGNENISNNITILNVLNYTQFYPNETGELQNITNEINVSVNVNKSLTTNLTFNVTASEVDYEPLTFSWFINGILEFIETLTSGFTSMFSHLFNLQGEYNVSVVVNGSNPAVNQSFTFYVNASNQPPTTSNVFINSTYGTNKTHENITLYWDSNDVNGDIITNITDWRINGVSDAILNLPFEAESNSTWTKDYSTYGRNGDVYNAIYEPNTGPHGTGAYLFPGPTYGNINATINLLEDNPHSLSFWMNWNGTSSPSYSNVFGTSSLTQVRLERAIGGNTWTLAYQGVGCGGYKTITSDTWHHVTIVKNYTDYSWYLDGVYQDGCFKIWNTNLFSSQITIGYIPSLARYFVGYLDEFLVYNRTLSYNEVLAHNASNRNVVESSRLYKGQTWSAAVTPSDGYTTGATIFSNNLRINALPISNNIFINSTFGTNYTNENLTAYWDSTDIDEDNITNTTDWRVNNKSLALMNMNFNINVSNHQGIVKDYSTYSNNGSLGPLGTSFVPVWNNSGWGDTGAYTFDGGDDYIQTSTNVSSGNNPKAFFVRFKATPALQRGWIIAGGTDSPGQGFGLFIESSGQLIVHINGAGDLGIFYPSVDTWYSVGVSHNGTVLSTYVDGAASASAPRTLSTVALPLKIGVRQSFEGTSYFRGIIDDVMIFNRSVSEEEFYNLYVNKSYVLSDKETKAGENWSVAITPNDGFEDGLTIFSNEINILNFINYTSFYPNETNELQNITDFNVSINKNTSQTTNLTFNVTASEVDYEPLTFSWFINGILKFVQTLTSGFTSMFSHLFNLQGEYNVSVVVNGSNPAVNQSFTFYVNASNQPPTTSNVFINSTYGTNYTNENLTAYFDVTDNNEDNVTTRINWLLYGRSYPPTPSNITPQEVILKMPFENYTDLSDTYKDMSGYGNYGVVNGAIWNVTGGHDGHGAYQFDGIDDYVQTIDNLSISGAQPKTIVLWFKPGDKQGRQDLFSFGAPQEGQMFNILYDQPGSDEGLYFGGYGASDVSGSPNTINRNAWNFVVATFDGTYIDVFINGNTTPDIHSAEALNTGAGKLLIGNTIEGPYGFYKGTIDDFMVFNKSLTQNQIQSIYQKKIDVLSEAETNIGDNWTVEVTPNDGYQDGATVLSNKITILINEIIITNVINYSITNESAIINWTTNELSNTSVNYGLTTGLGTISALNDAVLNHTLPLIGLQNTTTYHYNVTSCDAYSCTTSGPFNFTTLDNPLPACTDNDGDGFNGTLTGCGVVDCNDNNYNVIPPANNYSINRSIIFCNGNYNLLNGIAINYSNINIQCNQTTLNGTGSNNGLLTDSFNNISISGCSLNNYQFGLRFITSSNNTIFNNNLSSNTHSGIFMHVGSNKNIIINNTFNSNNNYGIFLDTSSDNNISHNTLLSNIGFSIWLQTSCNNNFIFKNNASSSNSGIRIASSNNNTVVNNDADFNSFAGVVLDASANNSIINNSVSNSFSGLYLTASSDNYLLENIADSNSFAGMYLNSASSNNYVLNNLFSSSSNRGVFIDSSSNKNTFSNNTFVSNTNSDIFTSDSSTNNLLIFSRQNKLTFDDKILIVIDIRNLFVNNSIVAVNTTAEPAMNVAANVSFVVPYCNAQLFTNSNFYKTTEEARNSATYCTSCSNITCANNVMNFTTSSFSTIFANVVPNMTYAGPNSTNETQPISEQDNNFTVNVEVTSNVTFNITANDLDASALTFRWFVNQAEVFTGFISDIFGSIFTQLFSILGLGQHNITAVANDSSSNDTFKWFVTSQDTTLPYFNQTPNNFVAPLSYPISSQINGTDSYVFDKYLINDTINFKINPTTGLLENNTGLSLGIYYINVSINDTSNNQNSTLFSITVQDITPPWFNETPSGFIVPLGYPVSMKINATDNYIFDKYKINDTTNFKINPTTGLFENNTGLTTGTYYLNVSINDTFNNQNSTIFSVTIGADITPPWFNETINSFVSEAGSGFTLKANASDNVAVDKFKVNDTTNFVIDATGLLQNAITLSVGIYYLNVSINDTSNNQNSTIFSVIVSDNFAPLIATPTVFAITNESASITIDTNENANTTLRYNYTTNLEFSQSNTNYLTSRTFNLVSLLNETQYYFNVTVCDIHNNCKTNGTFTFTTLQNTVVVIPPAVTPQTGGGSGGSYSYCAMNFVCGDWNYCINGKQTRICTDSNNCVDSKTETRICLLEAEKKEQVAITQPEVPSQPIVETPKPAEVSKSSGLLEKFLAWINVYYQNVLLIILALFLIVLATRAVDSFPLTIWKDRYYLRHNDVERADKLYDRVITRFGKSKKLERKYAEEVEKLSLEVDEADKKYSEAKKLAADTPKSKQELKQQITEEFKKAEVGQEIPTTKEVPYSNALAAYKALFDQYLSSSPGKRRVLEPKLAELRKSLLKKVYNKREERMFK